MSAVTRVAIRRPVLISMIFAAAALLGIVAGFRLPVTELPKVNFPAVTITTSDPGSNSQTVEQYVTTPIEQTLQGVTGVSQIDGTSVAGTSRVVVQLNSGVDVNSAVNQVSQAVGSIGRRLPTGASTPSVTESNPYATPLLTINFAGQNPQQLYDTVTSIAEPRLQLVSGVGSITLNGGVETNAQVALNPALLAARNVTVTDVDQALSTSSNQVPAGTITNGSLGTSIVTNPAATTLDELSQVVVATISGAPVTLGEVASITQAPAAKQTTSELDGHPNVSLTITAQDDANAISTDDAIKAELHTLQGELPAGVTATITSDTTNFTRASLDATAEDLILAIILASLVILLFLQSPRETLIVLIAIPTSLLVTLLAMYAFGFSIDIISLLAFSLLIGILVDDAIVVLENISRHLSGGETPSDAAYNGRTEIGAAAVALTLTDVVVFLPVVFASGVTGQILLEFGVTITVASLISLAVSFTLTPMLAARWLKPAAAPDTNGSEPLRTRHRLATKVQHGVTRFTDSYEGLLRATLKIRPAVLLMAGAAATTSILLVTTQRLPSTYVPTEDTGIINVTTRLPPSTNLDTTDTDIQQLATLIRRHIDGVTTVATTASSLGGGTLTVDLVSKTDRPESASTAAQTISRLALTIPGMRANATVPNPLIPPGSNGLQVVIRGADPTTVAQLANTASGPLGRLPQLGQVLDTANEATASYNIAVNQTAASELGVTQQEVAATLATAIGGTQEGTIETSQGIQEPIVVQLDNPNLTLDQLLDLPVATTATRASATTSRSATTGTTATGASASSTATTTATAPVTLSQVATITNGTAPLTVTDYDGLPEATVRASIASGSTTSAAVNAIKHAMASIHLPAGYDYLVTGANQQQSSAFAPLLTALELSPLLVYMLLAALYESLVLPFCVLLAVPLATAGAFCALVWDGQTINLFSLIGLLMLIGLVSKNAILLVDRAEQLHRQGIPRTEAIIQAGRTRLRPILMTTLTVVIAMLPIAFLSGAGSEDRSPMALVLVGGMTSSTLLTLIVVPTLYTYLDTLRHRLRRARAHRSHPLAPSSPVPPSTPQPHQTTA